MGKTRLGQIGPMSLMGLLTMMLVASIALNIYFYMGGKVPTMSAKNLTEIRVTRVIDGDTIDVESGERIRLYEIDAPEYPKECMGVDAKTRMEELVQDKKIFIQAFGKDNFGRVLAYVYFDRLLINQAITEEGLAYYIKGKTATENTLKIEQSESTAKLAGRGVWSSFCQTKKEGCLIKANYREADNSRIYHTPDCYNYKKITIKAGTSDRWFCNEEEAKVAGFRKSKDCPN